MDRRTFHFSLFALAAGRFVQPVPAAQLRVDGDRLNGWLQHLSTFGRNADGGVTRPSYTAPDVAARTWFLERMRDAGLDPSIDAIGNLVGRRPGQSRWPPIVLGSHLDSVPEGGRYDGIVGSVAALEVAQTLRDAGVLTRHPLEVLIFQNEENGKVGSKALRGQDPAEFLDFETNSGLTVREGIRAIGGDPDRIPEAVRGKGAITAFLELHIEQGAILESRDRQIGVVEGIVGIRRWNVAVDGFANHAGTTPMNRRRDALLSAARLVDAVNAAVRARPGSQVGTVGALDVRPGAANVIPGHVDLTIELRDLSMDVIDAVFADISARADAIARETGTRIAFDPVYRSEPATCDPRLQRIIAQEAEARGLSVLALPSGAGHDAQEMAYLGPIGMIFVPSRGGISHSAEEFTAPEDITNGANVLLSTLLRIDRELS